MNGPALATAPAHPLLDLLDREFAERCLGNESTVPFALWEAALYGPLRDFLARPGKEFRGALVAACHRLAGTKEPCPPELPFALEALHAGSLIVDDIEDESLLRRGGPALHRSFGVPTALNAGNWLYFCSLRLLDQVEMPPATRLSVQRRVNEALLSCHYGQALDLSAKLDAVSRKDVVGVVRTCTELKTGSLVALAAALGASAGGAGPALVEAASRFGRSLGVGLQMLDDLSGIVNDKRADKGREDLTRGRLTWPWAWAAMRLDDAAFASLAAHGRRVLAGEAPGPLSKRLANVVAAYGRREAHAELESAFARLREVTGEHPVMAAFAREIERLERSYV
jgi:geranylgeranyl pyrophosphate synthase